MAMIHAHIKPKVQRLVGLEYERVETDRQTDRQTDRWYRSLYLPG